MEESAAEDEGEDRAGGGSSVDWGMRTQRIHHPRVVLQVRSSSWGRERVSMYVVRRRWWIARLSMRDHFWAWGRVGEGEGDGVRVGLEGPVGWVDEPRPGMLGIDDRIVRLEGS